MTPEELERILLASDPERLKALAHQYGLCRVNLMWWIRKSVTDPVSCVVHQIKRSTKQAELSDALRVAIPIVDEWRAMKLPEPRPAPPRVKLVIPVETVCHSRAPLVERIRAPMLQTQSELVIKRAKHTRNRTLLIQRWKQYTNISDILCTDIRKRTSFEEPSHVNLAHNNRKKSLIH